jgi:homoserine dehydrogenase
LSAFVIPKFVTPDDRLYNVDDVFNGIITKTSFADTHFFVGRGAGSYPTASAVLSDISALSYDYRYEYKKIYREENLQLTNDVELKVLLRHKKADAEVLKLQFNTIEEAYTNHESGYLTGNITLENLKTLHEQNTGDLSFILLNVVTEKETETNPLLAFA